MFLSRSEAVNIPELQKIFFYLINLNEIKSPEVDHAKSFLDKGTLETISKYKFFKDQSKHTIVHAILRYYLGKILDKKASEIIFDRSTTGKPFIKNNPIYFSLSYTTEFAFIGLNLNHPIGVDLEQLHDLPDIFKMSKTFMHKNEIIEMKNTNNKLDFFFSVWCAKEAFLKTEEVRFDDLRCFYLKPKKNNKHLTLYEHKKSSIYLFHNILNKHKIAICL